MHSVDNSIISSFLSLTSDLDSKEITINDSVCKQCANAILNEKIPRFASPSQIRRNNKLQSIAMLTTLEERLVAPRMAFAQIRQLGYKRSQIGLTGTIINVPSDLDKVQTALPRSLLDPMTIAIMIKRKMEYTNAYLSGNVRPRCVMIALNDLCNTPLYKSEGICINSEWEKTFDEDKQKCNNVSHGKDPADAIDEDDDVEPVSETLIHGYGELGGIAELGFGIGIGIQLQAATKQSIQPKKCELEPNGGHSRTLEIHRFYIRKKGRSFA